MSDSSPSQRDPRIPLDASFVCAYTMWTCGGHVLPFDEACFFRRNEDCDELWIASAGIEDDSIEQWVAGESLPLPADLPEGVSVELACREAVEGGDTVSAASRLLERCLSRRIPFGWPANSGLQKSGRCWKRPGGSWRGFAVRTTTSPSPAGCPFPSPCIVAR